MTLYDGSFGYLIQGVSQQPARVQPEGHVKEQINMWSDPEKGLISRPGTFMLQSMFPTCNEDSQFLHVLLGSTPYVLAIEPAGRVRAFEYPDFNEVTVTGHSSFTDYTAGGDYAAQAVGDTIYLLNRSKTVTGAAVVNTTDIYSEWAYVFCLGGMLSRTYKLNIRYSDGTTATGTYTTPDDPSGGDQNKTSGGWIVEQLRTSIEAHVNFKAAITTISLAKDHLSVIVSDGSTYDITCEDGEGNTSLRCGRASAEVMENVPKYAPVGAIIRVYGDKGTKADDIWMRFESTVGVTTVGAGFGRPGRWVEVVDPKNGYAIDAASMPHVLTFSGSFTLARGTWQPRRCGNNTTNPRPGFIGNKITDLGEVSGRVFFIAGKTFSASQTRTTTNVGHNDFFRKTASEWLATDPIGIQESGGGSGDLLYGIPYDKNLVIAAEGGQFFINGQEAITPQTIAMPKTSAYTTDPAVKPLVVENYLLYPFRRQDHAGVNEVRPTSSVLDTYIDEVTKVVTKYIPGRITDMTVSTTGKVVVCRNSRNPKRLYVYQYLWTGNEKKQNAWHTWTFPFDILFAQFIGNRLYLIVNPNNLVANSPAMIYMDLDKPAYGLTEHQYMLDMQKECGVSTTGLSVSRNDIVFVATQTTDDVIAHQEIPVTYSGDGSPSYTATSTIDLFGSMYGVPFTTEVTLHMPKVVDWRGRTKTNVDILINKYVIDYDDSGQFKAYVSSPIESNGASTLILDGSSIPLYGDAGIDEDQVVFTGKLDVPWGYDPKYSDCTIKNASVIPINITEIRWYGEYFENMV